MSSKTSRREAYLTMFTAYPDVVNVQQLSEMLGGVSIKTCYKILKSGKIEYLKIGRMYRIPKVNVLRYLKIIQDSAT